MTCNSGGQRSAAQGREVLTADRSKLLIATVQHNNDTRDHTADTTVQPTRRACEAAAPMSRAPNTSFRRASHDIHPTRRSPDPARLRPLRIHRRAEAEADLARCNKHSRRRRP